MYLLDTNTLIYFFKGFGNVAEKLFSKSPKDIAISTITLYELEVGIAKSNNSRKRKKQLGSLVSRTFSICYVFASHLNITKAST